MKNILIIIIGVMSSFISFAQTDSSRVEQYCQLIVTQQLLSKKVSIDIDFGEEKSIWRDNRLKSYDGKIKKFNTIIDAMNYMAMDGWLFINAYPVHIADTERFHFAFKKQFARDEIKNQLPGQQLTK